VRITALERALGAPVVLRGRDGLHLTPLGEDLVPLVEAVQRAAQDVERRAGQGQARVRLAMPSGFTALFTANLGRLKADYPQLTLELSSGAAPVDLTKGDADLAIRSGPAIDQDLIARPLGASGWSLYASPAYLRRHPAPADLDDLRGHDLIGYDPALAASPAAKWIEQRLPGATLALRSREMADMLAGAASGVGLAALPCLIGDQDARLVRITPAVLATRPLSLVYLRESRVAPAVQAVIRFVMSVILENAALIEGTSGGTRQAAGGILLASPASADNANPPGESP
jgi:DNA-binding transcriptional LysR family regulator